LLARTSNAYELTMLGAALRDRSATACDLLERVFASQADFDPAAETREFTLLASDYGAAVFGAVEGTRRIAMIQERLARRAARSAAVRVLPCPFEAVPVREAMWWHPVHAQDAAHIWLRQKAVEVGATLG
jgi:DNA-binding transcriptional LysR family regulator